MGRLAGEAQHSFSTSSFKAAYRAARPPESDVDFLSQLQADSLTHSHAHSHARTHTRGRLHAHLCAHAHPSRERAPSHLEPRRWCGPTASAAAIPTPRPASSSASCARRPWPRGRPVAGRPARWSSASRRCCATCPGEFAHAFTRTRVQARLPACVRRRTRPSARAHASVRACVHAGYLRTGGLCTLERRRGFGSALPIWGSAPTRPTDRWAE